MTDVLKLSPNHTAQIDVKETQHHDEEDWMNISEWKEAVYTL